MLSAATMTISPIVIEIAIFSSQSAEKSDRFMLLQSCVRYLSPNRCWMSAATSDAR
jgi:hypothetical protein